MTPHPANVRRRIRQLKDYLILSGDWISYAIIDDITDVFVPLIQSVEDEVDVIDDIILQLNLTHCQIEYTFEYRLTLQNYFRDCHVFLNTSQRKQLIKWITVNK